MRYTLRGKRVWLWVLLEMSGFLKRNREEQENTNFFCKCLLSRSQQESAGSTALIFCGEAGAFPRCLVPIISSFCALFSLPSFASFPLSVVFHLPPSPRPALVDACIQQNVRASASHHVSPTRTSEAREPTKKASAFRHTSQARLRSPPV